MKTKIACGLLALVASACVQLRAAENPDSLRAVHVGHLNDARINESSGLAFSRRGAPILWTHNDSGDGPNLYALDTNGHLVAIFTITNATAYDWEDIASCTLDGIPYLVVADTGDNDRKRETCVLWWVIEPEIPQQSGVLTGSVSAAYRMDFTFQEGPEDCEAIAVAEDGRMVVLVSKRGSGQLPAPVYELTLPEAPWVGTLFARAVATVNMAKVVAMDISPDASKLVLLTYGDAYEFSRTAGQSWREVFYSEPRVLSMPWRSQGESICYDADGCTFWLTSENLPAPLWRVERASSLSSAAGIEVESSRAE